MKFARSLGLRKTRYRERVFLVEGTRLFADAILAGATPVRIFFDPTRLDEEILQTITLAAQRGAIAHPASDSVIAAVADTQSPQGVVAIFAFPEIEIELRGEAPLLIVADGVKDPGNLGTLLRSAAAAGAHALFVSPRTVDPFSPKVVRAGMGAHFRLAIRPIDWEQPDQLLLACSQRLAAVSGEGRTYDDIDWKRPTALILGSEATGISAPAIATVTDQVSIPMKRSLESLNVATAGAVILFEAARQRRAQ